MALGGAVIVPNLLRWYWWRINAWSEISAMVVSFVVTVTIHLLGRAGMVELSTDAALLWTVGVTTAAWLAVIASLVFLCVVVTRFFGEYFFL